jgi:integrase
MAKTNLRLDTRRALKDGTFPVQIAVGYGTNVYLSTGISVAKDAWDADSRLVVSGKDAKRLNSVLATLLVQVKSRILELREKGMFDKLTTAQLRQMLSDLELDTPTVGVPTLGTVFEKVIATKKPHTALLFRQTLKKVNAYCDANATKFDTLTKSWLLGFIASLDGLAVNSIAGHLKHLRNVINFAIDDGITTVYPFRNFPIKMQETPMRVLPLEKMQQLIALPLSGKAAEYRDMYLLIFYLIGINMVDLSRLTARSIVNGRIEYRRAKTGKLYSIKIEKEAAAIIEKYRGKDKLLRWFDGKDSHTVVLANANTSLGKMGLPLIDANGDVVRCKNGRAKIQPLYPDLTTYYARYSWATYAAELDIPRDTISEALGHKYGSSITGVYIKFSRDKIDAANRRVIDYALGL